MSANADVFSSFGTTVRALRFRLDRSLQTIGLRLGQYQLLRLLWEEDGLTPRELADRLQAQMPTVTRTLQRMVRDGLVRREAHPAHARSVRICLNPKGEALRDSVAHILDDETNRALLGFTASEQVAFSAFMDRIAWNVRHDEQARAL